CPMRGWSRLGFDRLEARPWIRAIGSLGAGRFPPDLTPTTLGLLVPVVQLRIPACAASFRGQVQQQPERIEIRTAARVLSGICHSCAHLSAIEMSDGLAATVENAESWDVGVFVANIRARVFARRIGNERQVGEPPLLLVVDEPLDG